MRSMKAYLNLAHVLACVLVLLGAALPNAHAFTPNPGPAPAEPPAQTPAPPTPGVGEVLRDAGGYVIDSLCVANPTCLAGRTAYDAFGRLWGAMQPEKIFWGKVTDFQKFPPDKSNKEGIFCTMPVTKLTYGASGGTGATARMNTCGSFGVPQRYGCYMIESVLSRVQSMADLLAEKFYTNLVGKVEFKQAVSAAAVLYIVIYGVLIMLGMIPATGGDVIMRLIKLGIIWACLISGWSFFYEYFGKAFAEANLKLIKN